jgi:Ca2+-transporting ATPase
MMDWHQKKVPKVLKELSTSAGGLSSEEARERLERYGLNALEEGKKRGPFMMFLDQFRDFMILVLIAAALIAGIIGDPLDTLAILVIVALNAAIGFIQEYRAEKAMAALKEMAAPTAVAIRNGMPTGIPAADLVPGDIVIIEAGVVVPADMRLTETAQLKVEEAALTGESAAIAKGIDPLDDSSLPIGDRTNMAYKGTLVTYGRGKGVVVETGMKTELGKIATMLQEEEEVKTPLQKRLAVFGRRLAVAILIICVMVFVIGMLRGEGTLLMLLTVISLAVAAIPEALPAVVTISLALGAKKMVSQNALIRRLPAVETLGSITYICSDKTGTLTLNKMSVEEIFADGKILKDLKEQRSFTDVSPLATLFKAMALSNDSHVNDVGDTMGDPTEVALFNAARDKGFDKKELEKAFPRVAEIPFDADRKCMTTFHKAPSSFVLSARGEREGFISFTKGAVDVLIKKATDMLTSEGLMPLDERATLRVNAKMAADGLRVICLAMRGWERLPEEISPDHVEEGLTIIGLIGIMDPPRAEAREAISLCKTAGIIPVMITGDHPITAKAIARRIGIIKGDSGKVITGKELERLSLEAFERRVEQIRVYARVAPEQKLKIVKALQDKGQFLAMTGDGVNDAPALKRADIGIAMGVTGTDVAKEAAHMILLDDNFATIVKAVKEGRKIFDNIRKFIKYLLTTNSGEIWTLFFAPLVGFPVPLLPIQLLWINLVTDGLPGLALSVEPEEGDVMRRPPRHPKEGIFAHGLGLHALWVGLLMAGIVLFVQAWALKSSTSHWQTMVFSVLCLTQLGHCLAIRSERESLFKMGLFSNRYLVAAVLLTFALQLATIYTPFLHPIFKTEALTLQELMLTVALSTIVFFAVEMEKIFKKRLSRKG